MDDSPLWHTNILLSITRKALEYLAKQEWFKKTPWYLAGGTALALQVGHRQSVDLDFFNPQKNFSGAKLLTHFSKDKLRTDILREGTIYGKLLGAKISFIAYPFFVPRENSKWYGNVRILDEKDIATMKIIAISQRGRKRDFVDLFWYLMHRESLFDILWRLPDQYLTVSHDYHHILKALEYFEDAESDPMPTLFFKATWSEIKRFFKSETVKIAKKLLRLK